MDKNIRSRTENRPHLTIVAGMGENRVIGNLGKLPWNMPADLAHFKQLTMGKPVIMGSTTFKAIGRPLPGRLNIVLSRKPQAIDGVTVVTSVGQALAAVSEANEAAVIGGQQVFELFLPLVNAIELTVIHAEPNGDTYFPELNGSEWKIVVREEHVRDERNEFDYAFLRYERV